MDYVTENKLINVIVDELRVLARAGANVPTLLRRIQEIVGHEKCARISIKSFRIAFDSGIASVKPVAGWCGFGGELSDEQVESFVAEVVDRFRCAR